MIWSAMIDQLRAGEDVAGGSIDEASADSRIPVVPSGCTVARRHHHTARLTRESGSPQRIFIGK